MKARRKGGRALRALNIAAARGRCFLSSCHDADEYEAREQMLELRNEGSRVLNYVDLRTQFSPGVYDALVTSSLFEVELFTGKRYCELNFKLRITDDFSLLKKFHK